MVSTPCEFQSYKRLKLYKEHKGRIKRLNNRLEILAYVSLAMHFVSYVSLILKLFVFKIGNCAMPVAFAKVFVLISLITTLINLCIAVTFMLLEARKVYLNRKYAESFNGFPSSSISNTKNLPGDNTNQMKMPDRFSVKIYSKITAVLKSSVSMTLICIVEYLNYKRSPYTKPVLAVLLVLEVITLSLKILSIVFKFYKFAKICMAYKANKIDIRMFKSHVYAFIDKCIQFLYIITSFSLIMVLAAEGFTSRKIFKGNALDIGRFVLFTISLLSLIILNMIISKTIRREMEKEYMASNPLIAASLSIAEVESSLVRSGCYDNELMKGYIDTLKGEVNKLGDGTIICKEEKHCLLEFLQQLFLEAQFVKEKDTSNDAVSTCLCVGRLSNGLDSKSACSNNCIEVLISIDEGVHYSNAAMSEPVSP